MVARTLDIGNMEGGTLTEALTPLLSLKQVDDSIILFRRQFPTI